MVSARGFVGLTLLVSTIATLALLRATHIGVSHNGLSRQIPIVIGASLLCGQIRRSRDILWLDRAVACVECTGLLLLATYVGAIASYPLAAISNGWYDEYLATADEMLLLDWPAYWSFVKSHNALNEALDYGYKSLIVTPTILLVALTAAGRVDRAYRFIAAYILALVATDLILVLIPAKSAAVHFLGMGSHDVPIAGVAHISVIEQLRTAPGYLIPMNRIVGLIAFPSFHAAAGLLFAWAAWPVRWLKWPCLVINILLFMATPIQGGHYFVEVIAGLFVAVAAISGARMLPDRAVQIRLPIQLCERPTRPSPTKLMYAPTVPLKL